MKCKVASKVIAASMAVAMVITMAGCGSSGKKVEARDTIYQRMKAGDYIREELTPDGLHPNDKGHKLVAEEIEKFLESVKAELEVEEKEPVFPKAMTENAYENAKRLTIREISPKLCGFHADTEEKTGHLDHFKNG